KLRIKQPALVNRKGPILLYDNAQPACFASDSLSPDLSSTDYHFSDRLNRFLSERTCTNQANIESTFKEFIDTKTSTFYGNEIKKFVTHANAPYFG
ncbi:Histone-lysine N-methyltransferase SETMAR, partial [Habropoda laboriosa]